MRRGDYRRWHDLLAASTALAYGPGRAPSVRIHPTTGKRDVEDALMNGELLGRVALVTGGARGIGLAIATRLASAGAPVAIPCSNRAALPQRNPTRAPSPPPAP